jgi:hypothetical protein
MRIVVLTFYGLLGIVASLVANTDAFCLPKQPPPTVQLGNNCRAMVLSWKLPPGAKLETVTLETLSQDVVIGLMGVSLMNPH